MIVVIRSRPEWSASESTPRLPVTTARNTFSDTNSSAEATDPSAASFFSLTPLKFTRAVYDGPPCSVPPSALHIW